MKYINNKIIFLVLVATVVVSCKDEYACHLPLEKPEEVANSEYLSTFDLLKSYVNSNSSFKLAANMSASLLAKKDIAYSTLLANFNAVDVNGSFTPLNTLKVDGTYDFGGMQSVTDLAAGAGIALYGGSLCSDQGQRAAYYNKLIEPIDIPVETETGKTKLFNFDDDIIGKTYPMTGNSSATVEEDPAGESGHVLHVGTDAVKANDSYAKLHVVLPSGRMLGDYVRLNIDLRHVGEDGIYGQGMKVIINGTKFDLGKSAADLGATNNNWKRSLVIKLNDAASPGFVIPENMRGLTEFDLSIGSQSGAAQYYLDNISMEYEVSGKGSTTINFEADELNATYPMTGSGTATVVKDPAGESGNALYINQAAWAFPKFTVKLKEGMTLKDYTGMMMDMRLIKGMYGGGMSVIINGQTISLNQNAAGYGFQENDTWKRGGILVTFVKEGTYTALNEKVPAGTIEIPDAMKDLNEMEFSIGSSSSNWTAYIDNLKFMWEAQPQHIEKTPEEKKEIFTKEMEKWIGGMVYAGVNEVNSVKLWNIISEPLDNTTDENTFKWSEYLGEMDYARTAVKIARDTVKNVGVELELFVSQTINQFDDMGKVANDLITLVDSWEADNVTKIDGYNILLHAIYSQNVTDQKGNEEIVTGLFEKLAASGKSVRVSDLSMMVQDANRNFIVANKLTLEERAAAADYLAFIMKEYRRLIPADKQYGISISGISESNGGNTVCPWTSGYNRNGMYEGVVEGLK